MIICFSITYFSVQYAYSIYDEQLYIKSSQVLDLSSNGIENELKKIERLSFNVATDINIQTDLEELNETALDYQKLIIRNAITDKLVQYAGYEKYVYSIEITDADGNEFAAGQRVVATNEKIAAIRKEAQGGAGENRWIYPDQENTTMAAARQIRSYKTFDFNNLGTVVIWVRIDQIVADIIAGSELKKGDMVIRAGDRIIYPDSGESIDVTGFGIIDRNGYMIKKVAGKSFFFSQFHSTTFENWVYYSLVPFDAIFNKIILMKQILLISFIASLLILLGLAVKFSRSITKPMDDLMAKMKEFPKSDLTQSKFEIVEVELLPMDEVGQLHRTFRMMIQQINELITENYAKQLTIRDAQFKALQAQINPHFLYNTLESINWLAKGNGQPQISKMVESLGFLLRNSISLQDTLITVKDELEVVLNYITIQKFRFEERLQFHMEFLEPIGHHRIPKLTLQPLVENAIHYALEPMIEPCTITIRAVEEPSRLVLIVEDNGPGMTPEQLDQVRKGEMRTASKGIGLKNIEERIVIAFGETYGIQVDSEHGKGTRISIYIPYYLGG
ncbi:sensor histidine kinase [Paenibacillus psychroresistens]|uniref:histidine kinase n=2 Tax=Paenibacillus psychroresistens TaxID=1778678 RepID=A0A6B8RY95_9BACL|nr:sensor histidine kinase [Paenibacillus psychroresistens]